MRIQLKLAQTPRRPPSAGGPTGKPKSQSQPNSQTPSPSASPRAPSPNSSRRTATTGKKPDPAGAQLQENEETTEACTPRTPDEKLRKILSPLENKNKSPGRSPLRQKLVLHLEVVKGEKASPAKPSPILTAEMNREKSLSPESAAFNPEEEVTQSAEHAQSREQESPRKRRPLVIPKSKFEQRKDLQAFLQEDKTAKELTKDMTIAKDGRIKLSSAYYNPDCRTKTPTEQVPEDRQGAPQPRGQKRVASSEPHTAGTLSPRAARNLKVRDKDSDDKKKRALKLMRNLSGQKEFQLPPKASASVVEPSTHPQV